MGLDPASKATTEGGKHCKRMPDRQLNHGHMFWIWAPDQPHSKNITEATSDYAPMTLLRANFPKEVAEPPSETR